MHALAVLVVVLVGCSHRASDATSDGKTGAPATTLTLHDQGNTALASWPIATDGDVPPSGVVKGSLAPLAQSAGLGVDGRGQLYTASPGDVVVFAANADGNVAPVRDIYTSSLSPYMFVGAAADSDGTIFAIDTRGSPAIRVFDPGANGITPAARIIAGPTTKLDKPSQIAVFGGSIYVYDFAAIAVSVFATTDSGDIAPRRSIVLSRNEHRGLAIDPAGDLVVARGSSPFTGAAPPAIVVYAPDASGTATPIRTITSTTLTNPAGVAVDADGTIYATNDVSGQAEVQVFAPGADGDVAPVRSIAGVQSTLFQGGNAGPVPIVLR